MQRTKDEKIWEILTHLFTLDLGNGEHTRFKAPSSHLFEGLKTTTWNLKYEWFNDGTDFSAKKINYKDLHIYSHNFSDTNHKNDYDIIKKKLKNMIYFCYRKNYKFYNTGLRSDTGWGCMIRCYQMLVCRAFYKIIKKQCIKEDAKIKAISFFKETPTPIENCVDSLVVYIDNFLKLSKSKSTDKDKDVKIWYFLPPFCIQSISYFGYHFHDILPGSWFGDVVLAQIFSKINEEINLNSFCQILGFQTNIDIIELRNQCFKSVNQLSEEEKMKIEGTTKFPGIEEEFVLNKPCLILVSVRLGLQGIAPEYLTSIHNLFSFKGCLGILGGKTNAAYYFFGYFDNEYFLYLDPHLTKDAAKSLKNKEDLNSYFKKDIHYIKFKHMAPSFTIGFLFRDIKEFEAFRAFVEEHSKREFPCFGFVSKEKMDKAVEEMLNNDKDDF